MKLSRSLYLKIIAFFLVVAFLPLWAASFLFYLQGKENTLKIITQDTSNLINVLGIIVEKEISDAVVNIRLLADSRVISSNDISLETKTLEMQKIYDLFQVFDDITLINPQGVILSTLKYDFRGDWRYKAWFRDALNGKVAFSPVYVITHPTKFVMVVTAPVFGSDGKVNAVLAGRIGLDKIWQVTDKIKIGSTGFVFITDTNGKIISFPDKEKILSKITPDALKIKLLANTSGIIEFIDERNISKICFYSTIEGTEQSEMRWRIGIIQNKEEINALIYKMLMQVSLIVVVCIFVILILAFILSSKIVLPIKSLVQASGEIARGRLESRVSIASSDEIGALGKAFNKMADDLSRTTVSIRILEEERKRFQDVAANTGDWIWEVDVCGRYTYSSLVVEQILGYKPEEVIGKFIYDFFHPDKREEIKAEVLEVFNKRGTLKNYLNSNISKDGKEVIIETSSVPMFDIDGRFLGYRGVDRDITVEKQVEMRMLKFMEALESKNKELDEFTYIVSHDLKEPLRSINAFCNFVREDCKEKLDKDNLYYLERIKGNAVLMQKLIDDLLELSRIDRKKNPYEEADTERFIEEVKLRMEHTLKTKNVQIDIIDNLPKVFCDRVLLTEVFANLISNAVKFMDKVPGRLEIGCCEEGAFYKFYIKDNGPGIEEKYFDKIFQIFQRLGKRDDYEGSGIGLTIVRKIVEMHKGKVWVESKVGEGAVFYFTIPKGKEYILEKKKIGEILVAKNLVTEEQVKKALEEQKKNN